MKASLIIFIGCCLLGLFLCYVEAASVNDRVATNKDFRSRRGFKNAGLSTARGFGKRSSLDNQVDDDESYPIDWLADYIQRKPTLMRYFVERLFDQNGDGELTSSEIMDFFTTDN